MASNQTARPAVSPVDERKRTLRRLNAAAIRAEDRQDVQALTEDGQRLLNEGYEVGGRISLLLASPDAADVRHWLLRRKVIESTPQALSGSPPIDLIALRSELGEWSSLDKWERTPSARRKKSTQKVVCLARELARALELDDGPPVPPVLHLFDIAPVNETIEHLGLQGGFIKARISDERSYRSTDRLLRLPPPLLALEQQQLPSLLHRLADAVEEAPSDRPRDTRPMTGNADARTLARHLNRWFAWRFDEQPFDVIATLVNIFTPMNGSIADGKAVREWLESTT